MNVGGMDADTERTGRYLQRVMGANDALLLANAVSVYRR